MNETNDLSELTAAISACDDQQTHGETLFPFVYECESSSGEVRQAARWVSKNRAELLRQSTTHGAVLLRGFPLHTAEDFDAVIQSLDVANFVYRESLSNAVRVNRTERVFSANEAPPSVQIFFHHEMAQTPIYPGRIFFFCEVAADEGGVTPICRSDILYERLAECCPDFIHDCATKGLQYTNVMPDADDPLSGMGRSWRSTLEVDSQTAAEARLQALNYSWEWRDGSLKATTPPLPAVMEVASGRLTFFNQLIAAFRGWKDSRNDPSEAIRHGDGSQLDANAVHQAIAIADELAFDVNWQTGDVVLIDNTVAMHARRSFKGTRKILASLGDMQAQSFELVEK
jgi:hypothetical protein